MSDTRMPEVNEREAMKWTQVRRCYLFGSLEESSGIAKGLLADEKASAPLRAGSALVLACIGLDEGDETHEISPLHYAQMARSIMRHHQGERSSLGEFIATLSHRMLRKAMEIWALSDNIFLRAEDLPDETENVYIRSMKVNWRAVAEVLDILREVLDAFDDVARACPREAEKENQGLLSPASSSSATVLSRSPSLPTHMVVTERSSKPHHSLPNVATCVGTKRITRTTRQPEKKSNPCNPPAKKVLIAQQTAKINKPRRSTPKQTARLSKAANEKIKPTKTSTRNQTRVSKETRASIRR